MKKIILTSGIFLAFVVPAISQYGGGGCSAGGLMDRFSDQSATGLKTFCSTTTFNSGLRIGLTPSAMLSDSPRAATTMPLYWGNAIVCTAGGVCGGGGGSSPGTVGGPVIESELGSVGSLAVWSSTYGISNSAITASTTTSTLSLNGFTLDLSPTTISSTTMNTPAGFNITSMGPAFNITASSLTFNATNLSLDGANLSVNGNAAVTTTVITLSDLCHPDTDWKTNLLFVHGIYVGFTCTAIVPSYTYINLGYAGACTPPQQENAQFNHGVYTGSIVCL